MIPAIVCALALSALNITHQPPGPNHPFRGSQEVTAPLRHNPSGGMTLEALHELPLTRLTWPPPQPQVWVYQPTVVVYPAGPGLGGYLPPGARRSHSPSGL